MCSSHGLLLTVKDTMKKPCLFYTLTNIEDSLGFVATLLGNKKIKKVYIMKAIWTLRLKLLLQL